MQENSQENYSINERILQIIEYYSITRYRLSQETGISEAVLLNISKGKNKPSVDFIEKLLNKYTDINPTWLLTGSGEMLLGQESGVRAVVKEALKEEKGVECRGCAALERVIEAKDEQIKALQEQIRLLNRLLAPAQEAPAEPKKATA